ncbi:MAG: agmatine deiminase family protein, partial [Gammaproteobacteria bacterium]|nr:agmatine deiminase family protein [Gammaproteobacteria bacterium]
MTNQNPAPTNYHMPAEWEPHEGTWLIWPHDDTHEDSQLHMEHLWLEMTIALHEHETVHIVVPDERRREHLQHQLTYYGLDERNLDVQVISNDDVWVRDCGPIFLVNDRGNLAVTTWNFNGWGERYPFKKDRLVPSVVADKLGLPLFTAPITLEGGALEVNGKGTLIATRSSIINPNRNSGKSQEEIETA